MKKVISIIIFGFILFIVTGHAYPDEKITLSTYYPAPYGEYRTLAVGDTYPAPDSTGTTDLVVEGRVGIGTTEPNANLHIIGANTATLQLQAARTGAPLDASLNIDAGSTGFNSALSFSHGGASYWVLGSSPMYGNNFYIDSYRKAAGIPIPFSIDKSVGIVGLGTTAPEATLHVNGSSYVRGDGDANRDGTIGTLDGSLILQYVSGTTSLTPSQYAGADINGDGRVTIIDSGLILNYLVGNITLDEARHGVGKFMSDTSINVMYNGNVGIGTTNPGEGWTGCRLGIHNSTANSPAVLELSGLGDTYQYSGIDLWDNARIYNNSTHYYWGILHRKGTVGGEHDLLITQYVPNGTTTGTYIEPLRIKSNTGKIGIGISNPNAPLHVKGLSWEAGRTYWGNVIIEPSNNGSNATGIHIMPTQNTQGWGLVAGWGFPVQNSFRIFDFNNNVERLMILDNGNIGIGTVSPGADKLDVRGRAYASGGWQISNADYAEWFEKEEDVQSGDIIGINLATGKARKYKPGDKFIGIHVTESGIVGNRLKETDEEMNEKHVLVALLGQVNFNRSQVNINGRVITTKDNKEIGILLSNDKILIGK